VTTLVSNTGPLIALGGIHRLDLLASLFDAVAIPAQVAAEVQAGGSSQLGVAAWQVAHWVQVIHSPSPPDALLTAVLDIGESAAIALAQNLQPSVLLMDEAKGRQIARHGYGLPVVGTGRILVEAKSAGLIPAVRPFIEAIRANASSSKPSPPD
jgi:uncharacterized protein